MTPARPRVAPARKRQKGKYANYFEVGHNAFEFVADFGQYEGDEVTWHTRVIMNPSAARAMCDLLAQSLEHYERRYPAARKRTADGK